MMIRTSKMASNTLAKRSKKSTLCSYSSYECSKNSLEGYSYCVKHILEDPNAPYKQCGFVYNTNGRKCQNPAPRVDKRDFSYCEEHARKAQIARVRSASKHTLPQTPEVLLLNLKHYAKTKSTDSEDHNKVIEGEPLNPFKQIDALKVNASQSDILDCASSSDSDVDATVVTDTIKTTYLDDSDNESVHDAQEDPLKHAGIYTAEEVVYISREKLIRLQSLYIEQFKRLQYVLREKRRKYLHTLKKEKETLCSIYDQSRETAKERKVYQKLKALNNYHKRSGEEAILYRKSLERRAHATEGFHQKAPSVPKCIFTEGGVKCGERSLPSAKHCRKHILKDQNQVLFKACGAVRSDIECHEPIPVIFDSNCVFHLNLPSQLNLQPMIFEEKKPNVLDSSVDIHGMEIDVVGSNQEVIDPEDDMAGLMREMNDVAKKPIFGEGNSETSTDTALSFSAHTSDKDEFINI